MEKLVFFHLFINDKRVIVKGFSEKMVISVEYEVKEKNDDEKKTFSFVSCVPKRRLTAASTHDEGEPLVCLCRHWKKNGELGDQIENL